MRLYCLASTVWNVINQCVRLIWTQFSSLEHDIGQCRVSIYLFCFIADAFDLVYRLFGWHFLHRHKYPPDMGKQTERRKENAKWKVVKCKLWKASIIIEESCFGDLLHPSHLAFHIVANIVPKMKRKCSMLTNASLSPAFTRCCAIVEWSKSNGKINYSHKTG